MTSHPIIRTNIIKLLLQLYDTFCMDSPPHYYIIREDIIKLLMLPIITNDEEWLMSRLINTLLPPTQKKLSRVDFIRLVDTVSYQESAGNNFGWVNRDPSGIDGVDGYGTLPEMFQGCVWQRMASSFKFSCLSKGEDACTHKYVCMSCRGGNS